MPNDKKFVVKNGLQTQNIDFVSNNESNTITLSISDEGLLSIQGNVKLTKSLYDANNQPGSLGQVLTSTENGVGWINLQDVQGLSGFSGISGFSGTSGFSGYSGTSGYSGKDAPAIQFDGGSPTNNYTAGPVFDAGSIT